MGGFHLNPKGIELALRVREGGVWCGCGCKKGWEGVTIEDSVCGESLKRSVGDDGVLPALTARLLCSKMTLGSI